MAHRRRLSHEGGRSRDEVLAEMLEEEVRKAEREGLTWPQSDDWEDDQDIDLEGEDI